MTDQPKPTPGPWEHNGNAVHKRMSPHFAECVCVCEGENRHANAALIARAPELQQRVDELERMLTIDGIEDLIKTRAELTADLRTAADQCESLSRDNQRLRELLREWIAVTADYANLELVVVDTGLIERSKHAIGRTGE